MCLPAVIAALLSTFLLALLFCSKKKNPATAAAKKKKKSESQEKTKSSDDEGWPQAGVPETSHSYSMEPLQLPVDKTQRPSVANTPSKTKTDKLSRISTTRRGLGSKNAKAEDDGSYVNCPDMSVEELAKIVAKSK